MCLRLLVSGIATSLGLCLFLGAPGALAEDAGRAPRYLDRIQALSEKLTSVDAPAASCPEGWSNRATGADFLESGCPEFSLPADYPHESDVVQLNLMAQGGSVFAVGVSHELPSWTEADALLEKLRADLARSHSCEPAKHLFRCTSGTTFVIVSTARDVPGKPPTTVILYVRDVTAFQAFYVAQLPASRSR